jgi:hypothetical protein
VKTVEGEQAEMNAVVLPQCHGRRGQGWQPGGQLVSTSAHLLIAVTNLSTVCPAATSAINDFTQSRLGATLFLSSTLNRQSGYRGGSGCRGGSMIRGGS